MPSATTPSVSRTTSSSATAALGAARGGHDAVRAAIVAAALHGNPRLHLVEPARREVLVVLLEIEASSRWRARRAARRRRARQRAIAVRPDDERHVLRLLEQLRSEPLRHAAGDAHDGVRLHVPLQLTQPADHALLGVIANGAGVDEDDVRAVRPLDRRDSRRSRASRASARSRSRSSGSRRSRCRPWDGTRSTSAKSNRRRGLVPRRGALRRGARAWRRSARSGRAWRPRARRRGSPR